MIRKWGWVKTYHLYHGKTGEIVVTAIKHGVNKPSECGDGWSPSPGLRWFQRISKGVQPSTEMIFWGSIVMGDPQKWLVFVEKIPIKNGWWLGVPLWLRKPPFRIHKFGCTPVVDPGLIFVHETSKRCQSSYCFHNQPSTNHSTVGCLFNEIKKHSNKNTVQLVNIAEPLYSTGQQLKNKSQMIIACWHIQLPLSISCLFYQTIII